MKAKNQVFPKVYKDKNGNLQIVYMNRVENYKLTSTDTKKSIEEQNGEDVGYLYEEVFGEGWNPCHECSVLEDSGFKEVHAYRADEVKQK